ncbi:MAG: isoleucine--tRNA ligase [bacterium]
MEYSKTINLPKTDFPMKANLSEREPQIQKKWEEMDIYSVMRKAGESKPRYMLHDGPPYANGHIHLGHALNKILKDIIVKYKGISGYDAPYVPGWDCHGLPIEYQILKERKLQKNQIDQVKFRKQAAAFANKFIKIQREEFKRLGIFGDWENPYVTMDFAYEAKIIEVFKELVKKDYIYKGLKPVHWCPSCETALAEAEVEYHDHTSPSVFVKFPLAESSFVKGLNLKGDVYVLIWTTTPWTLVANVAVCFHPDFDYVALDMGEKYKHQMIIMARELVPRVMEKVGVKDYKELASFKGNKLEGLKCRHPFIDREAVGILAEFVTLEEGTGVVHIAPGHGAEDHAIGLKYALPVIVSVNNQGKFKDEAGEFAGEHVFKANPKIIEKMTANDSLLLSEEISHTYPYCWRCKNPIVFRATEQWFMSVDRNDLRKTMLSVIKDVKWVPPVGENRISGMVESRPDWCLSRQRYWGVPLPIFYCNKCDKAILTQESISKVQEIFSKEGSDAWFIKSAAEILGSDAKCPDCSGKEFRKETDILDVWFDSGVSHEAVLKQRKELAFPADLYLEGSDQHRGWFQTSLIPGVALDGKAPFKTVLTHGFTVDGEGKKMSKSTGNVIVPQEIIKKYGADILRLWVCSEDYTLDMRISDKIISHLVDAYRRIRNTFRYLIGNLCDFDPAKDRVSYDDMLEVDKWTLHKLQVLIDDATKGYDEFSFHRTYRRIHNFCATDLSSFYLDVLKDRLYTFAKDSKQRRAAQTVLYELLNGLVVMLAPVLSFTSEEVWKYVNKEDKEESIFLASFPKSNKDYMDEKLDQKWQKIVDIYNEVAKPLEMARRLKIIGSSLEAKVVLCAPDKLSSFMKDVISDWPMIFIVSQVQIEDSIPDKNSDDATVYYKSELIEDLEVKVMRATGSKCVRCWNWSENVGKDTAHGELCERCASVVSKL